MRSIAILALTAISTPALSQDVVVMRRSISAPSPVKTVPTYGACTLGAQMVRDFIKNPTLLKEEVVTGWTGTSVQAQAKVKAFCEAQQGVKVCEGTIRKNNPSTINMRAFSVTVNPEYTSNIDAYGNSAAYAGNCVAK